MMTLPEAFDIVEADDTVFLWQKLSDFRVDRANLRVFINGKWMDAHISAIKSIQDMVNKINDHDSVVCRIDTDTVYKMVVEAFVPRWKGEEHTKIRESVPEYLYEQTEVLYSGVSKKGVARISVAMKVQPFKIKGVPELRPAFTIINNKWFGDGVEFHAAMWMKPLIEEPYITSDDFRANSLQHAIDISCEYIEYLTSMPPLEAERQFITRYDEGRNNMWQIGRDMAQSWGGLLSIANAAIDEEFVNNIINIGEV